MPSSALPKFDHGEIGLTRFPPNVEQVTIKRESGVTWLVARRNEVEIKFPLNTDDCRHLAGLLTTKGTKK
jgi:hypothetical protein